jgi:hypothetical protein
MAWRMSASATSPLLSKLASTTCEARGGAKLAQMRPSLRLCCLLRPLSRKLAVVLLFFCASLCNAAFAVRDKAGTATLEAFLFLHSALLAA